ncbi:MAG TPA: cell envelope integrity protein TolA [Chthoniobacterales bacterium]
MKRILFALALVNLLLPLAPRAEAATDVSVNFFYDNLSPYGSWYDVEGYGYVFQPSVAVDNSDWRPYADGYWAYTDAGWTWVSYEDFGWATYHYGRWAELSDYGWVWVPGYEWGPAWVSWRTGGDYIGWAPLPPAAPPIYEGRLITGHVDLEFDIGPTYYNFVDIRYIGEPVLRSYIVPPTRNVTIITQTVNVTNITYNNSVVNVYGPNYDRVSQYSSRPIQRLKLRRETQVSNLGQGGRRGNFNRVSGNELTVVAPRVQKSQQQMAPKQVKRKVEKPRLEHGWQGISDRQKLQAEMKKENPKNVRPPNIQPQKGQRGESAVSQPNETKPSANAPENANPPRAARPGERAAPRGQQAEERSAERSQQQQAQEAEKARAQRNQEQPSEERRAQRDEQQQAQEARRAERPQQAQNPREEKPAAQPRE